MTTAADIIKGALRRLQVIGSETAIEDDEISDGLEDLNDWAIAIEHGKVALGFVPVELSSDTVNIPREAVGMYKDNLALYMAGQYGAPIPQTLAASASDSMTLVLNMFQRSIDVAYPDTLPIGSGNECELLTRDNRFFDFTDKENF